MSGYLSLTLPDLIENALEIRFEPKTFGDYKAEPKKLQALGYAVQDFYNNFPKPGKATNELRPYIAPRFLAGAKLGANYVAGTGPMFEYEYDGSTRGEVVKEIKRYLLYCHGLAIHDRLPYLLDYFRLDPNHDQAKKRLPGITALLQEYSHIAELMRTGIVLPLSDEVFGTVFFNEYLPRHTDELQAHLPQLKKESLEIVESIIRHGQIEIERADHIIDLFFPSSEYVDVLRELLTIAAARFTSNELEEPFRVGLLASSPGLDLDQVNVDDIVKIRLNDELFERWRTAVAHVLERLHNTRDSYTDAEREAKAVASEELRAWKEDLKRRSDSTSLIKLAKTAVQSATIGVIAGAIADPKAGAGAALVSAALQLIWDYASSRKERATNAALRQHFLVLGVDT